jgi:hypothetical protein
MLASVHRRPPPSVSWADRDGWVSADTGESRRMRPHLRPAGPAGRCRQRGPHPAACTVPALACSSGGPRGLTALDGVEPAVTIACWLICPAQVSQAPGHTASPAVGHGPRAPSALPTRRVSLRLGPRWVRRADQPDRSGPAGPLFLRSAGVAASRLTSQGLASGPAAWRSGGRTGSVSFPAGRLAEPGEAVGETRPGPRCSHRA